MGSPPGYIGYNEAVNSQKNKRNPYSIVLMDEIEKAHPNTYSIFTSNSEAALLNSRAERFLPRIL